MGVVRVRAYYDYGYGRIMTTATGVLRLRLRANVRAYYVNFFTAYTEHALHSAVPYSNGIGRTDVVKVIHCKHGGGNMPPILVDFPCPK